jgi:hypothetical protein
MGAVTLPALPPSLVLYSAATSLRFSTRSAVCRPDALAIGLARVGQETQRIYSGTLQQLARIDFGGPLHSLVLVGAMHDLEAAMFERFRWKEGDTPFWVPPAPKGIDSEEPDSESDELEGDHRRRVDAATGTST